MSKSNNDSPGFITVNHFNEQASNQFRRQFLALEQSDQAIIPIVVDSFGGDAYSLLSMVSLIESSNKPVATICDSKAMSCGAFLFSCGKKGLRFISPRAYLLIHQVSHEVWGKYTDLVVSMEHTGTLNSEVFKLLDKNASKKAGYFERLLFKSSNSDLYFNAEEVVQHGLAEHISVPRMTMDQTITCNLLNYGVKSPEKISKSIKKLK
jgi:ATP-dependent Clp protease protease subunit